MRISMIGYGSMGKMITEKLAASDVIETGNIFVANRSKEKLQNVPVPEAPTSFFSACVLWI